MILKTLIVIGRNLEIQQLAQSICREVFSADSISEALDISKRNQPEMVIFDSLSTPQNISQFRNTCDNKNVTITVIGSEQNEFSSQQFISAGADHYLSGPEEHHLLEEIASRLNEPQTESDDFFVCDLAASVNMVGKSDAALKSLEMIKLVAASQCNPVLIIGETGTGKELAAKALHTLRHNNQPFVAVNCAALTTNLLESELFGHAKGSFTSADREKTGLIELAAHGTIFLDEISEMPLDLQAKLLRVIQEKTFRKVGGTTEIKCNATIIASSNLNLREQVKANRFRADLYYRLNVAPIVLAPLRAPNRNQDIPLLVKYFLKTSSICPEKAGKITSITSLALRALHQHDWSGNIRELKNVIERAILLETTDKLGLSSITVNPDQFDYLDENPQPDMISDFSLAKAERQLIARALQETNWQKTKAAELLGISRATLYAKVKQLSLEDSSQLENTISDQQLITA